MNALMELGATPWSQRPARPGRKSPRRHYRPLGLDREEALRASAGAPKYPHVVLDGDDLDGNALAMVAAVTSAMREADIPNEEVDAVAVEALSSDYAHVLKTLTGLITIRWRADMHPRRGSGSEGQFAKLAGFLVLKRGSEAQEAQPSTERIGSVPAEPVSIDVIRGADVQHRLHRRGAIRPIGLPQPKRLLVAASPLWRKRRRSVVNHRLHCVWPPLG